MKDPLHGGTKCVVVLVQWSGVLGLARQFELLSGCQQWFDRLVAQHDQRSERSESLWNHLIPACFANPADDVLAPQFFQVVGRPEGTTGACFLLAERLDLPG